jgi:hypothetical protein
MLLSSSLDKKNNADIHQSLNIIFSLFTLDKLQLYILEVCIS